MSKFLAGYSRREISRLRTKFWSHVHPDGRDHDLPVNQCWEWNGATTNGNPMYGTKDKFKSARYTAYALEVGDFDESFHVVTTCLNPLCVNPAHLTLVKRRPENDASDDLKQRAVAAVTYAVKTGAIQAASKQRCVMCGKQAQDYHHHKGYDAAHRLDVTPVCKKCHRRVEWETIR
jgi:hypothetical protein